MISIDSFSETRRTDGISANRQNTPVVLLTCTVALAGQAWAGSLVVDRPTLNTILGGSAVTENFETYSIGAGQAEFMNTTVLDSTAIVNGQGPNLVVPGLTFSSASGLQWNGPAWFGQPSKDILSYNPLNIDFASPPTAFGFDMLVFSGYPDTASIDVYAADDVTLLGSYSGIGIADPSTPVFFGYEDAGGIGRVSLNGTAQVWTPIIDDLTFGAVPEPGHWALITGLGLVAFGTWRRTNRKAA